MPTVNFTIKNVGSKSNLLIEYEAVIDGKPRITYSREIKAEASGVFTHNSIQAWEINEKETKIKIKAECMPGSWLFILLVLAVIFSGYYLLKIADWVINKF